MEMVNFQDSPKALSPHDGLCWNCLKDYEKEDIKEIHIPSLQYGSLFDGVSTEIHLCQDCLRNIPPEWWSLKIINSHDGIEKYEYEQEIIDFIFSMPIQGRELVLHRFIKYDDPEDCFKIDPEGWIGYWN